MKIWTYTTPLLNQNMYILEKGGHCLVIDPYYDEEVERLMQNKIIDLMLVTHEHYDHISGVNQFKRYFGCKLLANSKCNCNCQKPTKNFSKYFEAYYEFQGGLKKPNFFFENDYVCCADEIFDESICFQWQGNELYLKQIPGHSEGGNFIFLNMEILFSGDILLDENVPAAKFPGGDPKAFKEITLPYINSLSSDLLVYPGHGESFILNRYYGYNKKKE
ncbi:MAG: MBL fold metallo-hydrolase [Phascolarctobacterium sp.]|uniref:MBL fold metallo-hydrolase n=1 Tax=Phascolarctobacterium sp. TaxID=2049039 RepID=UPI0026DB6B25|nr:MBL fold metallo-hydrolase [Phascolarctobacterium sp.]MDO4922011.1 MBL fold metallo-hydrolase [Phascolarctobacterium sp.]